MTSVQIQPEASYAANSLTPEQYADLQRVARSGVVYSVRPGNDPCCFNGMSAEIVLHWAEGGEGGGSTREQVVGTMGAVHPEVLENFDLIYPCSVLEMDIEALM